MLQRFITLLAASLLVCGCLAPPPTSEPPPPHEEGFKLYAKYCGFCHGPQGEGYVSPAANALSNQDFLATASDDFLTQAIAMGRTDTKMSAWSDAYGGPLNNAEVQQLVAAMRSWQTRPSVALDDAPLPGDGEAAVDLFASQCASCHGATGEGTDSALSLGNPVFLDSASDAFIRHAIVIGRTGTAMKGYQGQLTDAEIDNLVSLIRSWQQPIDLKKFSPPDPQPVVLNPDGPEPDFELGAEFIGVDTVKTELVDRGARMVLIDARPTSDYALEHITGAVSIPFFEIASRLSEIPDDTWVISYCGCPHDESGMVAKAIRDSGHPKVAVLDEGYFVWLDKGYPVTQAP